ncbi:MAG: DUF47 domain-containing protein [Candidatus Heimdallarchaeota archaeon]
MSTRLQRWFEKRRTHKAIELLQEHARITLQAAEEFQQSLYLAREEINKEEINQSYRRVTQIEKEGDTLRRRILRELTQGVLPPLDREELARLARRMDDITDLIHGSSRILRTILAWFLDIPQDIREIAYAMSRTVVKCMFNVKRCLDALSDGNIHTAIARAEDVERIEEHLDDQYNEARSLLLTIPNNTLNASLILLLSQFLENLENTADRCEDATDQIRVLAVSAF